jgi:uncharacterized protein YggL (DUF469 family)
MESSLVEIENNRRLQVDEFNKRNIEDLKRSYFVDVKDDDLSDDEIADRNALAKVINHKLNDNSLTMDDMIDLHNQCIKGNEKEYLKMLLAYELRYFRREPKEMTLDEFKDVAFSIFERYQSKAGGKLIEDIDWIVYTADTDASGRVVMKNELLFENSIPKCDSEDKDTNRYLKLIVKQLRSICNDVSVDLRFKDDHDTTFIWIWCTHKKMDTGVPEIDL